MIRDIGANLKVAGHLFRSPAVQNGEHRMENANDCQVIGIRKVSEPGYR